MLKRYKTRWETSSAQQRLHRGRAWLASYWGVFLPPFE